MTNSFQFSETHLTEASLKAAQSLAAWIGRNVRLDWSLPERFAAENMGILLGPPEVEIPVCFLEVHGSARGRFVLMIDPLSIAVFVNTMLGEKPEPTPEQLELATSNPATFWDELAQSAALETANIVACSFLNVLAHNFETSQTKPELVPTPPRFILDYAGSLSEFLLADIAETLDQIVVTESKMIVEDSATSDWRMIWIPQKTEIDKTSPLTKTDQL